MDPLIAIMMCTVVSVVAFMIGYSRTGYYYDKGYEAGQACDQALQQPAVDRAHQNGYTDGYNLGKKMGYDEGFEEGSEQGKNDVRKLIVTWLEDGLATLSEKQLPSPSLIDGDWR